VADFRAIGGVSATLQSLLTDRMEMPDGVSAVRITVGPPKVSKPEEQVKDDPRVNLFLYRVTENGFLENQEIPGRGSGSAYGRPPLSLALHYLLTAYGSETVPGTGNPPPALFDEKLAHFLLGSAMRVLHDVPIVTEALTSTSAPSGRPILHESLRNEFERVKLTLDPLSLEDITKVWTALTLRYRLSAAYVVHVVQIESRRQRIFPKLVGKPISPHGSAPDAPPEPGPHITVFTFRNAFIREVHVRRAGQQDEGSFPYARIGDSLILLGNGLLGGASDVLIGDLPIPAATAADERIEVALPDSALPDGPIPPELRLRPGVRTVSVIVREPSIPGRTVRSNEAAFMLVPSIGAAPTLTAGPPRRLTVTGSRLFMEGSSGETLVGPATVPSSAYLQATETQIRVVLPDSLPRRGVRTVIGDPLPAMVMIGAGAQEIQVTIGGTTRTVTLALSPTVERGLVPPLLQAAIRDILPTNPGFVGARVALLGDRLLIVPGTSLPITIAAGAGTAASDLGLTVAQPARADHATVSGALSPFPRIGAATPRLDVRIGNVPPRTISFARPASIAQAAERLEAAVRGAGQTAAFSGTRSTALGEQIVIVPGAGQDITFGPVAGDETSVAELQLAARYAVRVRANGAESIDDAFVDLP
jgi:hypothetical protein